MYKKEQVPDYLIKGWKKLPPSFTLLQLLRHDKLTQDDKLRAVFYLCYKKPWFKKFVINVIGCVLDSGLRNGNKYTCDAVGTLMWVFNSRNEPLYNTACFIPAHLRAWVLEMLADYAKDSEK